MGKRGLPTNKAGQFVAAGEIKSDEQMDEHNLEVVTTSPLYSRDVDNGEKIGRIIGGARELLLRAEEMALDPGKKIRLSDTPLVVRTAERYLQSCQRIGTIPSKSGLAVACGCGRNAFDAFIRRQPNHPTAEFLQILFEEFADINLQAGQSGSCHPIFSIFILKALYHLRENDQVVPIEDSPLGDLTDTETLMRKYDELTTE